VHHVHFFEQNLQKLGFHYHHIVDSLGQKRNTLGSSIYISSIFDRMQKFTTPADKAVSNKKIEILFQLTFWVAGMFGMTLLRYVIFPIWIICL